jgi:adenosylmethionine---8-amino-7-oxononanoate aminotransferase
VADKASKTSFPWDRQLGAEVCRRARPHGLFIRPLGDVIVINPPLAITLDQLETMLAIIDRALLEVAA